MYVTLQAQSRLRKCIVPNIPGRWMQMVMCTMNIEVVIQINPKQMSSCVKEKK